MKIADINNRINEYSTGITVDEWKDLSDLITNKPDDSNEESWENIILKASVLAKKYLGNDSAIDFLTAAYEEYKNYYPNSFQNKVNILHDTCLLQMEAKKIQEAHETMNRYLYNALGQVKFSINPPKMHYYSFRGISDYALKEISEEKISLAHPRMFNDPLDTILVWWLDNEIKKGGKSEQDMKFRLLMKKASEHIKLRCLIGSQYLDKGIWKSRKIEDLSVLMWAHYANSHSGICIEYDFDKKFLKTGTLTNEEELVMIAPIEYVTKIDLSTKEPSMKNALFTKSYFWEYENEMRLCSYNVKDNDDYPFLECKGAIKAVYLGVKCSDENRRKVGKAIGDKDIPLYQMEVDDKLLTQLKKVQIG